MRAVEGKSGTDAIRTAADTWLTSLTKMSANERFFIGSFSHWILLFFGGNVITQLVDGLIYTADAAILNWKFRLLHKESRDSLVAAEVNSSRGRRWNKFFENIPRMRWCWHMEIRFLVPAGSACVNMQMSCCLSGGICASSSANDLTEESGSIVISFQWFH